MRMLPWTWAAIGLLALGPALSAETPTPLPVPPPMPVLPQPKGPSTVPIRLLDRPIHSPSTTRISPPSTPRVVSSAPATAPVKVASTSPATRPAAGRMDTVVVTSGIEEIRQQIAPSLGTMTFAISLEQIQSIPGGENATVQQVLLRAPGVVADSFGQEHVRGEHANLTYRVNGVQLPQPLADFGQELDGRLIQSLTLIDGTLPAQFGLHTAGVVDVITKSGETLNGNQLTLYGGSNDTFNPSVQFGGVEGKLDYFITASYNHNSLGIENPTASRRAMHDATDQEKLFGYFNYRLDQTSRLGLMVSASYADFQIPNSPGIPPQFALAGHPFGASSKLNENQNEQEYFTVVSYQKALDKLSFQASAFARYGQIKFVPDPVRDLIFQGVAGQVVNSFVTHGVQFDGSYVLNDHHTLRGGLIADYTTELLNTNTSVFPVDPLTGSQSSHQALAILDSSGNQAWEAGVYVQDEWQVTPQLTFNYGLRYDRFDANFDSENQVSPRGNVVYTIDGATTMHAGYSRYFVPPPVQDVRRPTLDKFQGTTNAAANLLDGPPRVERSNYYDVGISRQITKPWQVNVDGFYKQARNLVDLGQFGAPVILAPFNYREATVYGAELSTTYKAGGFSTFGNFSWVKSMAHDIDSQQFLIGNDKLAFIRNHNIHLDHESEFTVSAGASYAWKSDRVYLDFLYGSGLRGGFANTHQLQQHYPVNLGYEHVFHLDGSKKNSVKFRFDVINVFDESYQLRSGSGIGVGAPQFGQRRSFLAGLTYAF